MYFHNKQDPMAMTPEQERLEEEEYLYLKGLYGFVLGDVIESEAPEFKSAYFISAIDRWDEPLDEDCIEKINNECNDILVRECKVVIEERG